ncbi:hypothetical protein [Suilimivivens sp.]|uniref:hypothetical protein n=1 Tax=Suilimivivens sp. TaxID=2981669 RepID=UPI00307A6534
MEQKHDIVLYQIDDTNVCVSVYFENETFWLTTKAMAELFGVKSQAITKHLGNIYEEEELTREATCSKKEQVQIEGGREVKRNLDFYNLDAIIAVRFLRVKEEYPMSRLSKRLQRNMISSVCVRIRNMYQNLINKPKNISRVNGKQPRW